MEDETIRQAPQVSPSDDPADALEKTEAMPGEEVTEQTDDLEGFTMVEVPFPSEPASEPAAEEAPEPEANEPAPEPEVDESAPEPEVDEPAPEPEADEPAPEPEVKETKVSPVVLPAEDAQPEEPAQPEPEASVTPAEPTKGKAEGFFKPWMAAVAALVIAIAGFGGYQAKRASDYSQAVEHFEQGAYQEALQEFTALGTYKDAAGYAEVAGKWIDAQAKEKGALQNVEAWNEVAQDYDTIGSPEAKDEAQRCRNTATYYQACQTLEGNLDSKKSVQAALELFESCGGVFDANEQIAYCEDDLIYLDAKKLVKDKKWADATKKLDSLSDSGFRDASALEAQCSYWTSYEEAESYYNAGQYYEAYQRFLDLGDADYEGANATERASACIQPLPDAGIVYRNEGYASDDLQLTIDNSSLPNAYYKLYIGDDLVATVFIPAGGSATVTLPAGTYHMNKGYGETWFGTEDLFGDEGSYWKCTVGTSEYFELEYGWAYEISAGGDGTGITTNSSDRSSI